MQLAAYFAETRGAQAGLARALGVPQSLPSAWACQDQDKRRPVPVQHCVAIERATGGAVSRRDLRPDDWHLIWPELAEFEEKQATALASKEDAAIKPVAQEAAHG